MWSDLCDLHSEYESRVNCIGPKQPNLTKNEVEVIFGYIQTWQQRQCMCCYRDIKNFERFQLVVQSMICLSIVQLKNIDKLVVEHNKRITPSPTAPTKVSPNAGTSTPSNLNDSLTSSKPKSPSGENTKANQANDNDSSDKQISEQNSCENVINRTDQKDHDSNKSETDENILINVSGSSKKEASSESGECESASAKSLRKLDQNPDNEPIDDYSSKVTDNAKDVEANPIRVIRDLNSHRDGNNSVDSIAEDGVGAHDDDSGRADTGASSDNTDRSMAHLNEMWTLLEFERLLILLAKAFVLNFPLYIAYKHAVHARLDDVSPQDLQNLSIYCDLHENEMPIYLLRNVTLFCTAQGFEYLGQCFDLSSLPVGTAHAITAIVSNIKLWLNYRSVITLFVPIRSKILQYMCKLADHDLRSPATKSMADFMWTAIKDPLDTQITFDTDGLALAFKYFTSTTLTMRLAGMAQINAHINLFNDICTSETVAEVEMVGQRLSDWLIENKIINHLYGPNLHVEVIKQSPIVLRFLAVENQISDEHLNLIWQAAQLKHCSKAIYDVLPPLVKNLSLHPALHMYSLLCSLDPKEHTEQSIFIASTLIKLIWLRDGSRQQMADLPSSSAFAVNGSSSENSISIDGSNSDEEHPDDDSSDGHKSTIDIEGGSDSGPTPCKQPRHKNCSEETTDDSSKIEDIADETEAENLKFDAALNRINRRLVARIDGSSSDDGIDDTDSQAKKRLRKRRKINSLLAKSKIQGMDTLSDGDTDDAVDINDSDCSETQIQSTMLGRLHAKAPFIGPMANSHLIGMLSGGENDGSYSSPLSQKSGKNMADFDDDDSPCEEELAQLAASPHCLAAFAARGRNLTGNFAANAALVATKLLRNAARASENSKSNEVSNPSNILLWDLLMDDKIGQLGEAMAFETEKVLRSLLCFSTEKNIRTKFIESCLQNLATNRSVVVSLRLLPNLLASFQQFRAIDTHHVTMWAERTHKMMHHFFSNLKAYAKNPQGMQILNQNGQPMYSQITQVQVRLEFLTSIYSAIGSPENFRLSIDQVDQLWSWLANDGECADCLFAWLQGQAKNSEQHALGIDALQHLYLKKLPELRPEDISMVGLGLIQQLCSLARVAAQYDSMPTDLSLDIVGMGHLWKIALRAANTDVSLAAIQYINSYYMGHQLKMEKEFVAQCMNHLKQASEDLESNASQEKALLCVQRALMLLNTHLDTFRRRYAYHLRRWALEGKGFGTHYALRNEAIGPSIRIILQPGGLPDKSVLHMHTTDLVADLKAEIAKWWETLQGGAKSSGVSAPVLGFLLSEGPLRIITQGQEITSDYDERTIADVGFKDNQMIYVSLGGRGGSRRRETFDHPSMQAAPPKECLPTVLLLQPEYFEELFRLMQKLGDLRSTDKESSLQSNTKAQLLSRRVWDILALLPTNPDLLESFKSFGELRATNDQLNSSDSSSSRNSCCSSSGSCGGSTSAAAANLIKSNESSSDSDEMREHIQRLLDPNNLQKFMYSLHIVESLAKSTSSGCCSSADGSPKVLQIKTKPAKVTAQKIKSTDSIFPNNKTAVITEDNENMDPQMNCRKMEMPKEEIFKCRDVEMTDADRAMDASTASTAAENPSRNSANKHQWVDGFITNGGLRHLFDIFLSGVLQCEHSIENEWRTDCLASLLRTLCLLGVEELKPDANLLAVPMIKHCMMQLISAKTTLHCLASILSDASRPPNPHQFKTGFWGRAQVIHFAMNLLVYLVHSSPQARECLWTEPDICAWLQRFILDDPEPAVRREACAALYRICLGNSAAYDTLMGPVLARLISFLPVAEKMISQAMHSHLNIEDGKDPYGPACRDYFWLLCRLIDTLSPNVIKDSLEDPASAIIDIEALCHQVAQSIINRKIIETRFSGQDDGLVGLLNLLTNLIKNDPPFKFSLSAEDFISAVFDSLFDLPSPQNRQKPKCKSQSARAAAYDLLTEMCRGAPNNFKILHNKLLKQHQPGPHSPYPWDYWPRDDGRSECGYIGLTNLGATCYMASCIQHLFMMPQAREAVLKVDQNQAQKHATTLQELQRMFAYLMESERKSYNPRSFCRVYQMDHQPLNTGEQKDMAEFFIDVVSKMEEMTPDLKRLLKRLFCGILGNNVVSLDCGHVSRTQEDFYTVRCQVAQMRDLHESLAEVTVKDTLEGDNMYTCDQCGRKVRAEKRACFKKLPEILCFNTMRYTFNMLTMQKEKVNTHFSFPMKLDMSGYVEKTLLPQQYQESLAESKTDCNDEVYEYNLIGVTVHTGNADGGHYYSFIKERNGPHSHAQDRWFLFNDAEVKQFDPSQIENECFGGEMTSKTYDTVTEKYLDFSFEKTNSAYMLFYERCATTPSDLATDQGCAKESQDHSFDQASCSTTPTPNKVATEIERMNEAFDAAAMPIAFPTDPATTSHIDNTEADATVTFTTKFSNKCDIDNKSNNNGNDNDECMADTSKTLTGLQMSSGACKKSLPSKSLLNKELEQWIWEDNRYFLQDRNIFEHTYFNFMWQICGSIPQSLLQETDVTCMATQLSVSFFIETFIHAKEKPTMVLWVELLTKQFNGNQEACEWFLTHMSTERWWPVQILIRCPNQMVRQMFQRLVIHVIQRLRQSQYSLYLKNETDSDDSEAVGEASCVTRFIKSLISIMEQGAKPHLRHLSEFFGLLYEFSRMGEEETLFLLKINVIRSVADFYLGHKTQDNMDAGSDNEENSSDETLSMDKTRPASLDKMIALVATLVERSRGPDLRLQLSQDDYSAIAGGKGFPFLYQQIKDNINPHQTRHLIHALCRWDEGLADQIITMLFTSVTRHIELCGPFFKLLTLLTESSTGHPSGLPCFSQLVLRRVWEAAEFCPQSALDWLALQAPRNKIAHAWILQSSETWVEQFLLAHNNPKVRNAAAYLLVSLVPSQSFRTNYRAASLKLQPTGNRDLTDEAQMVLHTILGLLLRLLRPARAYTDILVHGPSKLSAYFGLMTYCMISKTEKLMLTPYIRTLWDLFHPRLSEPSVPAHHNKQALLAFWYHATNECPENAQAVASSSEITRNIAFNYILADHDDLDIVAYNRAMLPAYYGLLRFCCQQSRSLTRQLAAHQNLQWAFKNITPHPTQYALAVDELFCLMNLFAARHPDDSESEQREITAFRRTTLSAYLNGLDARVSWGTLIAALRILADSDDDRLFAVYNGGIAMCFEALITLHSMYHEATACHVSGDLQELLTELALLVKALRINTREQKKRPPASAFKHLPDAVRRLATLLNTHNPPQIRSIVFDVLTELVRNPNLEIISVLCPMLLACHLQAQEPSSNNGPLGPYFPRRSGSKSQYNNIVKTHPRPPRSMLQMSIPQNQLITRGIDRDYDAALDAFYRPYHEFLDVMLRMAVNMNALNESLANLSCLAGIDGAALHFNFFPRYWNGIYNNKTTHKWSDLLLSNSNLIDYVFTILRDKRISLNDPSILNFFELYLPKVLCSMLHIERLVESICQSLPSKKNYEEICGELLALRVIQNGFRLSPSVLREIRRCLQSILAQYKDRFKALDDRPNTDESTDENTTPPAKKMRISNECLSPPPSSISSSASSSSSSSKSHRISLSSDSDIQDTSKCTPPTGDAKTIGQPTRVEPIPIDAQSESATAENDTNTAVDLNKSAAPLTEIDDTRVIECTTSEPTVLNAEPILIDSSSSTIASKSIDSTPNTLNTSSSSTIDLSSLPANSSGEHEQSIDHEVERQLLRKMQCHSLELLKKTELLLKTDKNVTKPASDENNYEAIKLTSSTSSSSGGGENYCEAGPSQ